MQEICDGEGKNEIFIVISGYSMRLHMISVSTALILVLVGCTQNGLYIAEPSKVELCSKIWRYDLECAINHTLNTSQIKKVENLAQSLKGRNCIETSWNVLSWIEKNIKYDSMKAASPPPVIQIVGNEITVISGSDRIYQTPVETVTLRKGICGDYAILTAALLLASNCSPVYIFNLSFGKNIPNHITTSIKLNGTLYILDQHLPPMDTGSYLTKLRSEGKQITHIRLYRVSTNGIVEMSEVDYRFMRQFDYSIKPEDLEFLKIRIADLIKEEYGIKEDSRLGDELPPGYKTGKSFTLRIDGLADYYTPIFKSQLAEFIFKTIKSQRSLDSILRKSEAFRIYITPDNSDLVVYIYTAM